VTGLRWAAGALDGVMSHHGADEADDDRVDVAVEALLAVLEDVNDDTLARMYRALGQGSSIEMVDELLVRFTERLPDDAALYERLACLSSWLARRAPDREPAKIALALLGRFRGDEHRDVFMTLGSHDEFTLYAAVALQSSELEPEPWLWDLAKKVKGWGRIHLVERLADTSDGEVRDWLLHEGYKNDVMTEYLAFTCAVAGRLCDALAEDVVPEATLDAASDLLEALLIGGPAEDIEDYEDGPRVLDHLARHLTQRERLSLRQLALVPSLLRHFDEDVWEARAEEGWTDELRERVLAACRAVGERRDAADLVVHELSESDDLQRYWLATHAAEAVGVDAWPHHYRRLEQGEDDMWFHVMRTDDDERATCVVRLALERFDLEAMATGPSEELGLGERWRPHTLLDMVLEGLGDFPGLGWQLVECALKSPVVRNRHGALRVLDAWEREQWPEGTELVVRAAMEREPVVDVSDRMQRLLAGMPLDSLVPTSKPSSELSS
jgi:hypothetical protein